MGVKMTGRVTARSYAKKDPHFCSSGPIILAKMNSSSNDYVRPHLSHSRITPKRPCHRRQSTILSYLKRWMTDIWYSIMRKVKSIFFAQVDPDIPRSNSIGKIPSEMDSELENAFWREGIQRSSLVPMPSVTGRWDRRSFALGDNANVYSLYTVQQTSKSFSSDDGYNDLEKCTGKSEDNFAGLKNDRNLPKRIDSPVSFDEEYNALYEKKTFPRPLSGPGRACSKDIEKCGSLVVDYMASSGTKSKKNNNGGRVSPGLNNSERFPKKLSKLKTTAQNPSDGEWIQTACFGNVWYSRTELDNSVRNRQATKNRTRQTSRIPRLCSQTRKSIPKNQ